MRKYRNKFRYRKMNPETNRLNTHFERKLRFFQSGEYGEPTIENDYIARPHYHAIIFGHDFKEDQKLFREQQGNCLYTSDTLTDLWGRGHASVGDVTFQSAAYVARYVIKKTNASRLSPDEYFDKYNTIDEYGEIRNQIPEYATMSRASGIGQNWYNKYRSDAYPSDNLTINGVVQKPPKYYDRLFEKEYPIELQKIKDIRMSKINHKDNTPERLQVRETVKIAQTQTLKRKIK